MICHTERTGRTKVNNSATVLFHKYLPTKATIKIESSNAKILAATSLYISFLLEPDMSVIQPIPARHKSLIISMYSYDF